MTTPISSWRIAFSLFVLSLAVVLGDADGATSSSSLTATFVGVGVDVVSQTDFSPDGLPDFQIRLDGLRSAPTQVSVTTDTGGIWNTPFDGSHWVVGLSNFTGSGADIYFAQFSSNKFHVQVGYADGTFDQADATKATGPSPDTVRFVEQSTFGPTNDLIAHVQQVGFEAFLNEQFAAPMTDYPELEFWPQMRPATCTNVAPSTCQRDNYTMYPLQRQFFVNALSGQDQLRQRVALVWSEILVTSAVDVPLPSWMRGYQQLLYRSAFGNFRQLLYDITLSPTMGRFLDMLNNRCQTRTPPDVNVCRNGLKSQRSESGWHSPAGRERESDCHLRSKDRRGICTRVYRLGVSARARRTSRCRRHGAQLSRSDGRS
jgi:hypothetical protein